MCIRVTCAQVRTVPQKRRMLRLLQIGNLFFRHIAPQQVTVFPYVCLSVSCLSLLMCFTCVKKLVCMSFLASETFLRGDIHIQAQKKTFLRGDVHKVPKKTLQGRCPHPNTKPFQRYIGRNVDTWSHLIHLRGGVLPFLQELIVLWSM
jgi:hypothetical protein